MRRRQVYAARAAEEQSKAAFFIPAPAEVAAPEVAKKPGRPLGSKNKTRK
jgi:hypothetical protein